MPGIYNSRNLHYTKSLVVFARLPSTIVEIYTVPKHGVNNDNLSTAVEIYIVPKRDPEESHNHIRSTIVEICTASKPNRRPYTLKYAVNLQ